MFKSILVPTDGSRFAKAALDYAIQIAKKYKALIYGLFVVDIRALEASHLRDLAGLTGIVPVTNFREQVRRLLEERGWAALEVLKRCCKEKGVKCELSLSVGVVAQTICKYAHSVDLVVMGKRGEYAKRGGPLLGSILEAVVKKVNKPLIATSMPYTKIDKVLMAYDGSDHANDALEVAANMCKELSLYIAVLNVSNDKEEAASILSEAERLLLPYKLKMDLMWRRGHPEGQIISTAKKERCDLIVMGAYGHTRMRELILGSTTEHVLRKAELPVLLYR